jgi:hypothetical protein
MTQAIVDVETGELHDLATFMEQMRDLDSRIADADTNIDILRENLKTARQYREMLVAELRAAARGDRALPFTDSPSKE